MILKREECTPAEFIHEMEGCVKEGSPIPKIDPLRLKRIWEKHDLHGRHPCGWGGEKVKQKEQKLEGYIKTLLVIEREEEL